MPTLNLQPGQSEDDAHEHISGSGTTIYEDDFVTYGSRTFGHCGLRFPGVSGLAGATIESATLTHYTDADDDGSFDGDMYAEDAESPPVFTQGDGEFDITGRTRTTASENIGDTELGGAWTGGNYYECTVDLKAIIQELADSYDPTAIVLLYIYSSGTGERLPRSYDFSPSLAPTLEIVYTPAGTEPPGVEQIWTGSVTGGTSAIASSSSPVTAGNAIVVTIEDSSSNNATFSVSDDQGNTYNPVVQEEFNSRRAEIWVAENCGGATTEVTVTGSTSSDFAWQATELSPDNSTGLVVDSDSFDNDPADLNHFAGSTSDFDPPGGTVVFYANAANADLTTWPTSPGYDSLYNSPGSAPYGNAGYLRSYSELLDERADTTGTGTPRSGPGVIAAFGHGSPPLAPNRQTILNQAVQRAATY